MAEADIAAAFERVGASEILTSDKLTQKQSLFETFAGVRPVLTVQPASLFDSQNAGRRLETMFGVGTLESFGAFSRAEIAAAGSLIDYIDRTQKGKIPHLNAPRQLASGAVMEIDAATRRSLELTRTMNGDRKGSLLATIDRTITGPGARALQARLSAPLRDVAGVQMRLDQVESLVSATQLRGDIRTRLKSTPDMERALSRLTVGRGGPRDLTMIREGLRAAEDMRAVLLGANIAPLSPITDSLSSAPMTQALLDRLHAALKDDVPALERDGGFIRAGYSAKLDQLRMMRDDAKKLMAGLQAKYQAHTGIDALKITYNNVLGYFIEVPAKRADPMMIHKGEQNNEANPYIHRQTMANAVRFTTPELAELERDVSSAGEKSLGIELELFRQMVDDVAAASQNIGVMARALADIDVTASLAHLAIEHNYTRPQIDNTTAFVITGGRHPVVESVLRRDGGAEFVPNDCDLSDAHRLWLLTGPNMAGKSTFLRQNALIAVMAKMGSFVPAKSAHIGLVDRLFSRVGASDDLARGRSTFMVEMVETAAILNQATKKSLVILDEIGRGTATFDGLSIAWACVEHLHEASQCRSLFATHYHELTRLQSRLASLSCHSMQVKEWNGDIIFLHSVGAGAADRSYGIHVARLAGLPGNVIARAQDGLGKLGSREQSGTINKLTDELPLFSTVSAQKPEAFATAAHSELEERVKAINPDALTPREALSLLYELKAEIENAQRANEK